MFKDFDDLANWFVTLNSHFSPSELHGAVIGLLSGGVRQKDSEWQGFVFAIMGVDPGQPAVQDREQHQVANDFVEAQLQALAGDEMSFSPYLPDDDVELALRTESLGSWCRGFLGGFAESQVHRQREDFSVPSAYPDAVQEAIKDITEIARATYRGERQGESPSPEDDQIEEFDHSDDPLSISAENAPADDELAENDYLQVSEYVRLAALTVFTEFGWVEVLEGEGPGDSPDSPSTSIH